VVVGRTTMSSTTEAREARPIHHHSAEIFPIGAGGYPSDPARYHAGVAHRYRGICFHITGSDNHTTGTGKVGTGTCIGGGRWGWKWRG
ncbi:hypothetical protein KI387_028783, partial [Taxus chinensis]